MIMEHISLLPVEYKKQKLSSRKLSISTVAMIILTGVAVFAYVIVTILSTIPEAELRVIRVEHEMLSSELKQLEQYNRMAQDIKQLGTLASKAVNGQPDWLELFVTITGNVPEGLRITNVNAVSEDNSPHVNIRGYAQNHDNVAAWLDILKNEEKIAEVKLKNSQYAQADGDSYSIEFEMDAVFTKDIAYELFKEDKQ